MVRRGIKKKFTDDLAGGVGQEVIRLGQAGYIVKGIAYVVVGGLFGWAGVTYDAEKAGGLDDALRTVHDAPLRADPAHLDGARAGLLRGVLLLLGPASEGQHQRWRQLADAARAIHSIDTRRGCKAGTLVTS